MGKEPEKATNYMIPPTCHSGKGKTMQPIKLSVVTQGWSRKRNEQVECRGSENTLYDATMIDTYYYTFVLTQRTQKIEPSGKLWTAGGGGG